MKTCRMLGWAFISLVAVLLAGCGGGGGPATLFSDDFESYCGDGPEWPGDWVDASAGQEGGDGVVGIVVDDASPQGRVAKHTDGGWCWMVYGAFTGSDYTYHLKIKPGSAAVGMGLTGRVTDSGDYYYLQISGGNKLDLFKSYDDGATYEQVCSTVAISYGTDTYYQLKLVCKGNQITGYFEDSSISYTDDGIAHGPVITGGKIGFGGDEGSLGYFDEALVTS